MTKLTTSITRRMPASLVAKKRSTGWLAKLGLSAHRLHPLASLRRSLRSHSRLSSAIYESPRSSETSWDNC